MSNIPNTTQGIVIGFVGLAIVIALLIIPSFAGKDTQFFVTNTVNATSIALGDLTDVTLINTLNNQILVYNSTSSLWENENQTSISTSNATCSNLGSGKILCASYSGNNLAFKSLLAGSAITLSNDTNTITITNAGVWHDIAGTGISVNQTSGNVLITNTLPESTVCSNATSNAGHYGLCKDSTITLRDLLAGSGISLSLNSTDITINNTGVISLTSDNSAISYSGSSGSITTTPKYKLLAQITTSTSITNKLNQNSGTSADCNFADTTSTRACGEHILSGGALVGTTVNSITVNMKKTLSPTGTLTACVMDTTPTCVYTFGTMDISALTTSYATYTFTNLGANYTIATGDIIGIKGATQSGSNTAQVSISTTDVYDTTKSVRWQNGDVNTSDFGSSTNPFKLDLITTVSSGTFTATKNIFFTLESKTASASTQLLFIFNGDVNTNYAYRISANGGADVTGTSATSCGTTNANINSGDVPLIYGYINNNISTDRKLINGFMTYGGDSAVSTAPSRTEFSCKWGNTSDQITKIQFYTAGSGTLTSAVFTVWGYN